MTKLSIPTYSQLKILLQLVAASKQKNIEFIEQKFSKAASNFQTTSNFLTAMDLVDIKNGTISLNSIISGNKPILQSDLFIKKIILSRIANTKNKRIKGKFSFLKKFYFESNHYIYQPSTAERVSENEARNLLIELEFIQFGRTHNTYVISPTQEDLLLKYISNKAISLEKFKNKQLEKDLLGMSAEMEIIKIETERLEKNPQYKPYKVKQVSIIDVSAGYDILSWNIDTNNEVVQRYIEVKAVSGSNFSFYWTQNELNMARRFGERYYLYLLPLESKNCFNVGALKIIRNPYVKVFKNTEIWDKKVDTYKFTGKNKNE